LAEDETPKKHHWSSKSKSNTQWVKQLEEKLKEEFLF